MVTVRPDLALAIRSIGCFREFQSNSANASNATTIRLPTTIPVTRSVFLSVMFTQ
jgi:hypothetical protein